MGDYTTVALAYHLRVLDELDGVETLSLPPVMRWLQALDEKGGGNSRPALSRSSIVGEIPVQGGAGDSQHFRDVSGSDALLPELSCFGGIGVVDLTRASAVVGEDAESAGIVKRIKLQLRVLVGRADPCIPNDGNRCPGPLPQCMVRPGRRTRPRPETSSTARPARQRR